MTKHTPGPWFVEPDMRTERDGTEYLAGYDVRSKVTEIIGCEGLVPGPQSEADAHLIAAAPEMLAALHLIGMSAGWQYLAMETRAIVESAIDKAEGR